MKTLSPKIISDTVDSWRIRSWPMFMRERMICAFYNSGPLPLENECEETPPTSLGLGYRYLKKPHDQLCEAVDIEPGLIKVELPFIPDAARKTVVESAIDTVLNAKLQNRLAAPIRSLAGRALVTGRAFLYRRSRWDWMFREGRLLCDMEAGEDIQDSDFREWAFHGKISLRDIDAHLESTREYEGAGWNREGLKSLKTYILETTSDQRDDFVCNDDLIYTPFKEAIIDSTLDVYWYYRKNGETNEDGDELVDLWCISRYQGDGKIDVSVDGTTTYKSLNLGKGEKGVYQLYHLPNAFESVTECLIPFILDGRIDGDTKMLQVEGTGKIMVPRIMGMERLADAILEGVAFGVQPNWTSGSGSATDEEELKKLSRTGIGPWDYVPPGLVTMNKQNGLTGMSSGMQMIQMLGMSVESDAATGDISPLGESQARFKDEANQLLEQVQQGMGRRANRFYHGLDVWVDQMVKTFCRSIVRWIKGDAGYNDVAVFQFTLLDRYGILPIEYDEARVVGKARRLSGDASKAGAIRKALSTKQMFGGDISPEGNRWLTKEALRAMYGDTVTQMLMPDTQKTPLDQQLLAVAQNSQALTSLTPPERNPQDDPMVHVPIHGQVLQTRLQLAMQTGGIMPVEKMGLMALLQHMALDAVGLPSQMRPQIEDLMKKGAQMLASIPVTGGTNEMALKERAQNLKEQDLQLKAQDKQSIMADRQAKQERENQKLMLEVERTVQDGQMKQSQIASQAVQNAAALTRSAREGVELDAELAQVQTGA